MKAAKQPWNGRPPPCYEYLPSRHTYVFHVSEEESVELSATPYAVSMRGSIKSEPRYPLIRLLTGVSPVDMLCHPERWARYFGSKDPK